MTPPPQGAEEPTRPPEPAEVQRLRAEHGAAIQALQAAVRDTTRLTRLFTILSEPAPLELLLDQVLSTLSEIFTSDVVLLLQRADDRSFRALSAIGLPEDLAAEPIPADADSHLAAAAEARVPRTVRDGQDDPGIGPTLRALDVRTAAWLPVTGASTGGAATVLVLARCSPAPYAPADLDLLAAMAYRIGLVLERARSEALLREAHERLLRTEKLALAGRLAGSIVHEVNNPLACVYVNLNVLQQHLPTIAETFRAARAAALFLADGPESEARAHARRLLDAMAGTGDPDAFASELTEVLGDSIEGARRIGALVTSFRDLSSADRPAEPESLDVRAIIDECVSALPPDTGRPPLVHEATDGLPCMAFVSPSVLKAAMTGLLRFLLAPGLRRGGPGAPVTIRAERVAGSPAVVISDPSLQLSAEELRTIFDPRMEEVDTPRGRMVRLSLVAPLSHQLLRSCGAELEVSGGKDRSLVLRILLPAAP